MTEAQTDPRRERSLTWIAREFYYTGGVEMARALRSGTRIERETAIATMEDRACAERRRGLAGHWTYDLARHTALARSSYRSARCSRPRSCKLRAERSRPQVRQVRHHLHRRGWAPISELRRLGTARGGLLAAIAGRCSQEDTR